MSETLKLFGYMEHETAESIGCSSPALSYVHDHDTLRTCTCCGKDKMIDCFYPRKRSKDGWNRQCKMCVREKHDIASLKNMESEKVQDLKDATVYRCVRCDQVKSIDNFHRDFRIARGFRATCASCYRTQDKHRCKAYKDRVAKKQVAVSLDLEKAIEASREASEKEKVFRDECDVRASKIRENGLAQPDPKPTIGPIESAIRDYRRAWRSIKTLLVPIAEIIENIPIEVMVS